MDAFGFAHLRTASTSTAVRDPPKSAIPSKKANRCARNEARPKLEDLSRAEVKAFSRLYFPVNTIPSEYQKRAVLDCLAHNTLIAMPNELDLFLVAAVVMANFRRWFPKKKVLYIGLTASVAKDMAELFMQMTGYPGKEVCIYGMKKKNIRSHQWAEHGVIFATAENIVGDLRKGDFGSDVGLVVVDDAHRALSGSHPLCEVIRRLIILKAIFRVIALSGTFVRKLVAVQSMLMNLQIASVRLLSHFITEVSRRITSPRMQEVIVPPSAEVTAIAEELFQGMRPLAEILHEGGVLPTADLNRLSRFSRSPLKTAVEERAPHLADVFLDLGDLFDAFDKLMCEGVSAFGVYLRENARQSATIQQIVEASRHIKKAFFFLEMPVGSEFSFHKVDACCEAISDYFFISGGTVVILCRRWCDRLIDEFVFAIRRRFVGKHDAINILIWDRGNISSLNDMSLSHGKCNIIVLRCGADQVQLNIAYVDLLICLDEGLSSLHYTGGVHVVAEGRMISLRTDSYETNMVRLVSAESARNFLIESMVQAANLCDDDPALFPEMHIDVVEYWADTAPHNQRNGSLSTFEHLAFEENFEFDGGSEAVIAALKGIRELLSENCKNGFAFSDRAPGDAGLRAMHSSSTRLLSKVLRSTEEDCRVIVRHYESLAERWSEENAAVGCGLNKETTISGRSSVSTVSDVETVAQLSRKRKRGRPPLRPEGQLISGGSSPQLHRNYSSNFAFVARKLSDADPVVQGMEKRRRGHAPGRREGRAVSLGIPPRIHRIDSPSFHLVIKKISVDDFKNPVEEGAAFCERRKCLLGIMESLKSGISL